MKILGRGAEAVLVLEERGKERVVRKDRVRKGYRIAQLDFLLRKRRTKAEASLMSWAARAGVNAPRVWDTGEDFITMEYIEGESVKESFESMSEKKREEICRKIGEAVGKLHSAGIMHGDLTTSNMIVRGQHLYLLDFGLGKRTTRTEDFATDLLLLMESLKAAHFRFLDSAWRNIIKAYKHNYTNSTTVLKRVEKIALRRRYK